MSRSLPDLKPFDHLIYTGHDIFGLAIEIKTASLASHIEVFRGGGMSLASRNGEGVNEYTLRRKGLAYILRPNKPFNLEKGLNWFKTVQGLPYGWMELINFYLPRSPINVRGMVCSVFAACLDHHSDLISFNPKWSRLKISPADYLKSPVFDTIYSIKD